MNDSHLKSCTKGRHGAVCCCGAGVSRRPWPPKALVEGRNTRGLVGSGFAGSGLSSTGSTPDFVDGRNLRGFALARSGVTGLLALLRSVPFVAVAALLSGSAGGVPVECVDVGVLLLVDSGVSGLAAPASLSAVIAAVLPLTRRWAKTLAPMSSAKNSSNVTTCASRRDRPGVPSVFAMCGVHRAPRPLCDTAFWRAHCRGMRS